MGLVVTRYDTACRRRISYSQAVRAGDHFIFKLNFLLYGHVMYKNYFNRLGPTYATRRLHVEFVLLKYILLQPLDLLAFS